MDERKIALINAFLGGRDQMSNNHIPTLVKPVDIKLDFEKLALRKPKRAKLIRQLLKLKAREAISG